MANAIASEKAAERAATSPANDKHGPKHASPDDAYEALQAQVLKYQPQAPVDLLRKAYKFAAERHGPQLRHSGDPYIMHPLAVATILTDLKVDPPSLIAAILHDVVEDTETPLEEIEREFSKEIAELVDGLTKIGKIQFRSSQEKLAENFRKMVLAMAKDIRVILVKLADRLHNMRTLNFCPQEKRDRVAQETLEIYAPLAHRLGIYGIKSELEDLCLRQLKRDVYTEIRGKVAAKKAEREAYIEEVKQLVEAELKRYGLTNAYVYGRPKHFYSIYKKMIDRQLNFEDVHDLFAFRIIVDSLKDCYEALGIVHALWKPMPGRFKDYIAMPKANLYQSLHTTVIRPKGEPAEFQIRTREMHEICEFGVAAHWAYKENKKNGPPDAGPDLKKFSWMRQMMAWQSEIKDPDEFLEAVKVDLFDEEIYVFTPRGDVVELSTRATALDFAFAVHTDVGLRTIGAKINGRMVPIKAALKSGDIIEIVTSPNQRPNKDWLNFVVTSKARNKIRSYLRTEQRDRSRKIGLELLTQELGERDVAIEKVLKSSSAMDQLVGHSKEASFDELLISLGYGRISPRDLVAKAYPDRKVSTVPKPAPPPERHHGSDKDRLAGIIVSGIENVLVNFGRCCNPLPGETVVGYITRGRGVTVHRANCSKAMDIDPQRKVEVLWTAGDSESLHSASIRVVAKDQMGVLADITSTIAACGGNIQRANVRTNPDQSGVMDIELGIKSLGQLQAILRKLESLPSVVSVERRGPNQAG